MNTYRFNKIARLALALMAFGILAACGSSSPKASSSNTPVSSSGAVSIKNFAFNPQVIKVKVGTKVTWTNNDSTDHAPASDSGVFTIDVVAVGKTASFTFTKAGTFKYHCRFHPSMTATVIVVS